MKLSLGVLVLMLPLLAQAAGGGGHDDHIPKAVIYQVINVLILAGGIFYFTKDAIVDFFAGRKSAYLEAAKKSAMAREQAEKAFEDIKGRLADLDNTRDAVLMNAKNQAEELKKQMAKDAEEVSLRIRQEAELTARLEVEKAQKELRTQLLRDSLEAARNVLTKDIGAPDQSKLQNEFINNVEVVSR